MRWWWQKPYDDAEIEREIRTDLELEAEEREGSGLSPEQAQYAARKSFGNITLVKEQMREMWAITLCEQFVQDCRYGIRLIRKTPGVSILALLTLAVGIGANTALFSLAHAVLLRPLPYADSGSLVSIWQSQPMMNEGRLGAAPPEFDAYRSRNRVFSNLAGYQQGDFDLTGQGDAKRISGYRVTAALFPTLAVQPLLGRTFTSREELPGAGKVVVLSYQFWKQVFAGDPHVIGKLVRLNEEPHQIIGVMPRGFTFPATAASPGDPPAVWAPLSFSKNQINDWASSYDTKIIARLKNGAFLLQAQRDAKRIASQFQQEHPDIYSGNIRLEVTAELWSSEFSPRTRTTLTMLSISAGFVLLIACVNVANLLIARAGARQREMSVRHALGGSTGRITRQVLTETLMLTISGTALGMALAIGLLWVMNTVTLSDVNISAAAIDLRTFICTLLLSGATSLCCGIAPVWLIRTTSIEQMLRRSGRQSGQSRNNRRFARCLVMLQITCCVILLIGSGLLIRSFNRILEVPLGFDPAGTLVVRTTLNRQRYTPERRHSVERALQVRLLSLPGVLAVALTTHVPLADKRQIGFGVDGRPADEFHWADNSLVSENYFSVMKIPLLRGQAFPRSGLASAPMMAVINQSMARHYWPGEDPIGKGFTWGGRHIAVIGVAGDVQMEALDEPVAPTIYNSVYQIESGASTSAVFLIRVTAKQNPLKLAASVQNSIWSIDKGLPILGFTTLEQVVRNALALRRLALTLVATLALVALFLSLIGIYGVLSFTVTQRIQEMGLRSALGARPVDLLSLILGESLRLALAGTFLGCASAAIMARYTSRLLFRVPSLDPVSFAAAALLLLVAVFLASYLPARRASSVNPMVALKYE